MSYIQIPMFSGTWGYRGTDGLVVDYLGTNTPVLAAFDLRYTNGDHHVQNMIVGGKTGEADSYLMGLSDLDFGVSGTESDAVTLKAVYYNIQAPHLTAASERTVSGTSTNRRNNIVSIARLEDDEVFVLRGFEFFGSAGRNHHLRMVEVRFGSSRSEIKVNFVDDSPADDTYRYTVRFFILKRMNASLHLLLNGPYSQDIAFTNTTRFRKLHQGNALLAGFSFRFMDSDHHFSQIAVDVQAVEEISLTFTDNEQNHAVQATIDYVVLDWSKAYR